MNSLVNAIPSLFVLGTVIAVGWWLDRVVPENLKAAIKRNTKRALFWGALTLATVLALRSGSSLGSGMLALFMGLLLFAFGIGRLAKRLWWRTATWKDSPLVLYSLALVVVPSFNETSTIEEHEANFEPLFAALEDYRQNNGAYPETLTELVPNYVPALPQCPYESSTFGRYYSAGEGTYHLECTISLGLMFPYRGFYNPERGDWIYYD